VEASTPSHRIRFGKFEVDPESGELFKDCRLIRLQGQPIQILLMLLEKPGRLVTREELQHRLWPIDTFVDFDYGLNAAVKRLRESLGDSADESRYIETLPRRGYRFIFPVEEMPVETPRPVPVPSPSWILRLWSSMTQSPASLPQAEEEVPAAVQSEVPAVQVAPEFQQPERGEAAESQPGEVHQLVGDQPPGGSPAVLGGGGMGVRKRPLAAGQRLGPYEVAELLGAGGMGEVYKARDTRLDRAVAIKTLPAAFLEDPERLARFEREAKLLASLNHPNVAAIYGLEEVDGKRFLVLELVEGKTLSERIAVGADPRVRPTEGAHRGAPLQIDNILDICRQIADGLEAAHEKGIIHRDLKPANIKITPEGKVKILDFGLAKALKASLTSSPSPSGGGRPEGLDEGQHSPTLTDEINGPGVIIGSAVYMSPEQATGKPVDRRTDVWAFGCVLFECLTGRQAFQGETVTDILAAILKDEPDWQALPAATPWRVKDLLHRCLRKDPRERLHDIADARIEIGESLGQPLEIVTVARPFFSRRLVGGASIIFLAGVFIGLLVRKSTQPAPSLPVVRSVIKLESGQWLDGMRWGLQRPTRTAMAMSKDGGFIVYSTIKENPGLQDKSRLYLRRTDQSEAKPIAGTEGGINPFLSPDDRWVGFWAGEFWAGKLMKVSIDGGVPVTLCDAAVPLGASWASDNSIIFSYLPDSGLFRVSAKGGEPESLTTPDKTKEENSHRLPHCLPDGKGVLFTIMRELFDLQPRVAWLDLQTRKWRVLMEDAADARYVPTGHLVFLRKGTLMVVPFDLVRHEVTGQPVPTIANVMQVLNLTSTHSNVTAGQFSISDSGWLVYAEGGIQPDMQNSLVWVDQKGRAEPITSFKAPFGSPRLSPDGQRIAYASGGRESGVWVYDLHRGTTSRLTNEGKSMFVSWTPDGKRVGFGWLKSGQLNLYWIPADGSSAMERLTTSDYTQDIGPWSPDGTTLAFVEEHPCCGNLLLLDLRSRRITPFLNSGSWEAYPEFSPDGRWMAYVSDDSGREEVYVRPFPGPGGKWLISQEGGVQPLWARNGKQLFYRSRDWGQVWVADVWTDGGFSASKPRLLFKASGMGGGNPIRTWDLSLDGQRFLMVKLGEPKPTPVTELVLVQNWFEELKRLAPTNR